MYFYAVIMHESTTVIDMKMIKKKNEKSEKCLFRGIHSVRSNPTVSFSQILFPRHVIMNLLFDACVTSHGHSRSPLPFEQSNSHIQ